MKANIWRLVSLLFLTIFGPLTTNAAEPKSQPKPPQAAKSPQKLLTEKQSPEQEFPSENSTEDKTPSEKPAPLSWRSFDEWLNRSGINLSKEQQVQLEALRGQLENKSQGAPSSSDKQDQNPDPAAPPPTPPEQLHNPQALWQQYQQGLSKILTPEQQQRIRKQWYQFRGLTVLADADVADKLKLTAEQRKEVQTVMDSFRNERTEAIHSTRKLGKVGRQKRRQILTELRQSRDSRLEKLLNAEQKQALEKLGDSEDSAESLPVPTLSDDFIDLGPAQKSPPQE